MTTPPKVPKLGFRQFVGRGAVIGAPIASVIGTLADIGSPLFDFAAYLAALFFVGVLIVGFFWFFRHRPRLIAALKDGKITEEEYVAVTSANRWYMSFSFVTISFLIMTVFAVAGAVAGQKDGEPNRGLLASQFPALVEVQNRLFGIEKRLDRIEENTQAIREQGDSLKQDTTQIIGKLDEISRAFENLSKSGTLVSNPKTPTDFYHNARIHELTGDFRAARQAYQSYIAFNLDFIDPHLSYLTMLKVQEGSEGAREVYDYLLKKQPSTVIVWAHSLLQSQQTRLAMLEELTRKQPDFAPALWQLSIEYSENKLGSQTLKEKNAELRYLQALVDLGQSRFLRFFIDKKQGVQEFETILSRHRSGQSVHQNVREQPVSYTLSTHNGGTTITLMVAEGAKQISYRFPGEAQFRSTGTMGYRDPRTGEAAPNPNITVAKLEKPTVLEVKYLDAKGTEVGPFEILIDPVSQTIEFVKRALQMNPEWVLLQNGHVYFTHLLVYRNAISEIRYSLDSDAVNKVLPMKPWNSTAPSPISAEDTVYIDVPNTVESVSVQVKYKDGSTSEINVSHKK